MSLEEYGKHFKNRVLFYPCAGRDIDVPIDVFVPHITEFWFVDEAYTREGSCLFSLRLVFVILGGSSRFWGWTLGTTSRSGFGG